MAMIDDAGPRSFATWSVEEAFPLEDGRADPLLQELAATALDAAQAAAAVLIGGARRDGAEVPGVQTKISATDMVSDVDRASEAVVTRAITRRRPDDEILGEEGTDKPGSSGIRWVVDPLDGTTNFLFGIPQWSVSIAAESGEQRLVGVVIDPSRQEVWTAMAGHGSFLNGQRCRVPAGRSTLATALVATGFGYRAERRRWQAEVAARVIPAVRDIRRLGSAALDLCWTGGGRFDAYYEWGLNPWDLSAGALVAAEAGAVVEVLGHRMIVAAPPDLFGPLTELLAGAGAFDAPSGTEPELW